MQAKTCRNVYQILVKLRNRLQTSDILKNYKGSLNNVYRQSFYPFCSLVGNDADRTVEVAQTSVVGPTVPDISKVPESNDTIKNFKMRLKSGPTLEYFISNISNSKSGNRNEFVAISDSEKKLNHHPYVKDEELSAKGRKVYFEVYGCQMNVNDTEIVWSILQKHGYKRTLQRKQADVILIMTCSIREGAEKKVWNLLEYLRILKQKRESTNRPNLKIGILGCMAENLKHKLVEQDKSVDLVAGPDSYRDLPRMLAITENSQTSVNVLLSLDETYADIVPIRLNEKSTSAYISIMRGCDNMCSYCIVPFTRGRERSRPLSSILQEIRLLTDQGVKEVILLGQNVNSYRDTSIHDDALKEPTHLSRGFSTIYKTKLGGQRFYDLLDKVSEVNPEIRIRFTSPHPKDFPDEVLHLMKNRPNICKQIHLPAQSGNDRVLKSMRRGYTRKSYVDLAHHIRSILPDVALSSDFICGFCDETEEEFLDTLSLIREIKYHVAYLFSYSMRQVNQHSCYNY